jgi:hypothetical protein
VFSFKALNPGLFESSMRDAIRKAVNDDRLATRGRRSGAGRRWPVWSPPWSTPWPGCVAARSRSKRVDICQLFPATLLGRSPAAAPRPAASVLPAGPLIDSLVAGMHALLPPNRRANGERNEVAIRAGAALAPVGAVPTWAAAASGVAS